VRLTSWQGNPSSTFVPKPNKVFGGQSLWEKSNSHMQEITPQRPTGIRSRLIYLGMLLAPFIGLTLCGNAIRFAAWESNQKMHIPKKFSISEDFDATGKLFPNYERIVEKLYITSSDIAISGDISGKAEARWDDNDYDMSYNHDKPGRPFLCLSLFFIGYACVIQVLKLYQIIRRKKSAIGSTLSAAKAMGIGAILCYAGSGHQFAAFLVLSILPYAGIGYLAYTRWERVRSQLYNS
jgi:hypothetical protein